MNTRHLPPTARAAVKAAPESWQRWLRICDTLESGDVDATAEEFVPFLATFRELRRLKVPFADSFVAAVEELELSIRHTDDDADQDASDEALEDDGFGSDARREAARMEACRR